MKCKNCGTILKNPNARYCPHCGIQLVLDSEQSKEPVHSAEPVRSTEPIRPVEPVSPAELEPIQHTKPKYAAMPRRNDLVSTMEPKRRSRLDVRTIIIAVLAVIIVLLLATGAFLLVRKPGNSVPTPTAAASVQAEEPTPTPVESATPAPATPAPENATPAPALQMPTADAEPEYSQDVFYPNLDVQPTLFWRDENQALFRVATNADNLNMRKGPGTNYDLVGKAPHDAIVSRVGKQEGDDGWILIQYDGIYGWVSAEYLAPLE